MMDLVKRHKGGKKKGKGGYFNADNSNGVNVEGGITISF